MILKKLIVATSTVNEKVGVAPPTFFLLPFWLNILHPSLLVVAGKRLIHIDTNRTTMK